MDAIPKIIGAERLGELLKSVSVLESAVLEAQAIIDNSHAEVHAEKERGYREGLAQARAEIAEQFASTAACKANELAAQEHRLTRIVMRSLAKILQDDVGLDALYSKALSRVMRSVQDERYLTLRVPSADIERVQIIVDALTKTFATPPFVEVIGDAELAHGACIVESEHGAIDASLDTQLKAIERALRNSAMAPQ
jgi:type III secretion protein L